MSAGGRNYVHNALSIDPALLDHATPRQREVLQAVIDTGSGREAARQLGVDAAYPGAVLKAVKKKAALQGYAPDAEARCIAPDGFKVKGKSLYYDAEGKIRGQWLKTEVDKEQREAEFRAFVESLVEPIKGLSPLVQAPTMADDDLMVVYPIGDHHHGMYATAKEAGDDYDCKISQSLLTGAVDRLCSLAPPAKHALLLNLGDFTHANDATNETPGHGNRLDVDTRYEDVMDSGAMALIHCVLRLMEKHENVTVWCMPGNHDPDAYFAIAMAIKFYFHNQPRVTVDMTRGLYKYTRFGKNLIGSHHGHGAKGADLPLLMATDRPEDWGATEFRVMHCGHIHHRTVKEHPGCTVETHRTLAGKDAWHAGKGYRSGRDMTAIVYHRDYGEIQRTRCDVAMLQAA